MSKWEMGELEHLSRSADHLGSLANVLKDLGGDDTILHELAQNADDAEGATRIRFSVDADALTVWNDGVFSNCGDQGQKSCPWRDERGRSCDLHSFRLFSGRHKSSDASTTGAFGVGFTCVYHVTDHPELVTAGTHLLLNEGAAESQRIRVCQLRSCPRDHDAAGTTFVLPWAKEHSHLREQLEVETVDNDRIAGLEDAFRRNASATLLFLKRVSAIDLVSTASGKLTLERESDEDIVRVITESSSEDWLVLADEYSSSAELKRRYREINPDRSALVQVAIRVGIPVSGRFYAGLPSRMPTGWSGHINGSFYPRTDRKSFEFSDGTYRSDWNLDLLDSAADLLSQNLERVTQVIGVSPTWEILRDLQRVARDVSEGKLPRGFERVYTKVARTAADQAILQVVDGSIQSPTGAVLPVDVTHYPAARIVHGLGLSVVDPDLRSVVFETDYTKYGVHQLTASRLIEHLNSCEDLARPWTSDAAILDDGEVDLLLELLESLLERSKSWIREPQTSALALVPCVNSRYASARDAVRIDEYAHRELFARVDPSLFVVDSDRLARLSPTMLGLVGGLDLASGLESLRNSPDPSTLTENAEPAVEWLDVHRHTLALTEEAGATVRALPIFPRAGGGRDSLVHLSIPSDFDDLFRVADLVDPDFVQRHWPLLEAVGARELSAVEYLTKHLLPRLGEVASDAQDLEFALDLVYKARRELDASPAATALLRAAPLVTCTDGAARRAAEVHMPNSIVTMIDPATPIADLQTISNYLHDTVVWLGASTVPSRSLINEATKRLAHSTDASADVCAAILEAIADAPVSLASVPIELANLRDLAWLPVDGGGKAKPCDVYPTFQSYLFESQGPKLGLSGPTQQSTADALYWLGMPRSPTSTMVVDHLLHCAAVGDPMNNDVYVWLGRELEIPALQELSDAPVVQTSPGNFIHPRQAFWQPTQFGRWASQLPHDMRRYQVFLDGLGIRDEPTAADLDFILKQVATEVGTNPLDPEDELVVHECWAKLDALLFEQPATARALQLIGRRASFPDRRRILAKPEHLIFRDPRKMVDRIPLLADDVIDRERRTQRALECAGVTKAEEVIAVEPIDVISTKDTELLALLAARHVPLLRAIDSVAAIRTEIEIEPRRIVDLDIHLASTLTVVYRAAIGSQQYETTPQAIDAILFAEDFRVVHTRGANRIPVAREISRAIAPYLDPAELAPLIVTVLDASSAADAMLRLDDYGVPAIVDIERGTVASSVAVDVLERPAVSHDIVAEDEGVFGTEIERGSAPHDSAGAEIDGCEDSLAMDDDAKLSTMTKSDSRNPEAHGKRATVDARDDERYRDQSAAARSTHSRGGSGAATRMRSYVLFADESVHRTTGDESPDALDVDRAGVDRVLAHERAHGREPEEQHHANPGFDVLSRRADGEIARRIEIKSIGGPWTVRGVMLSARQFREAREHGDEFWLYIVENAEDDDLHRIHRIRDPANRIDFFGFDNGWDALREPDIELDTCGAPAARSTRGLLGISPGGRSAYPTDH